MGLIKAKIVLKMGLKHFEVDLKNEGKIEAF